MLALGEVAKLRCFWAHDNETSLSCLPPDREVCVNSRSRPRPARPGGQGLSRKTINSDASEKKSVAANDPRGSIIERLERALVLVAYIVLRHGPIYAPYIDRLERELEIARQNDPKERATRILETYAGEGSPNALRLDRLRSTSKDNPSP
jgi:hypothetical protein